MTPTGWIALVWTLAVGGLLALDRAGSPLALPLSALLYPLTVLTGYALRWWASAIALVSVSLLLTALGPDAINAHLAIGGTSLPAGATTFLVGGVLLALGAGARLAQRNAREAGRAEALEASNADLEALAQTVAHDLRAPVRAIRAYLDAMHEDHAGELTPAARAKLQAIAKAEGEMSQLIDRSLEFARVTGQELTLTRVDMRLLAEHIAGELQADTKGRDLTIVVGALPPAVGDEVFLRQVLQNLMSNAVKYTQTRASARIEVGWTPDGGGAYFVRDNGVGFDMHRAGPLFQPFKRLHSSSEFEGNGAGLAIAARIVSRHGGRIWGDAAVDQGATFSFTLPHRPARPRRRARPARLGRRARRARSQ